MPYFFRYKTEGFPPKTISKILIVSLDGSRFSGLFKKGKIRIKAKFRSL